MGTSGSACGDRPLFESFESYRDTESLSAVWSADAEAKIALESKVAFSGSQSLRCELANEGRSVTLKLTDAQDWTKFDTLSFYVSLRQRTTLSLTYELLRSDSPALAANRVEESILVPAWWHRIDIGLKQFKDRNTIRGIRLILSTGSEGTVYFDDFSVSRVGRWRSAINGFIEQDEKSKPDHGGILFVGSSSIRMWNLKKWFPEQSALNRGFGGSQISDVNHYYDYLVQRHVPNVIVFYCGDNDIAAGKSPQRVFNDFKAFADRARRRMPKSQLIYIPIKPSIARWKMWPKMQSANDMIQKLSEPRPNLHYADTATPMLGEDGKPMTSLFIKDGLHLSDEGYRMWTKIVARTMEQVSKRGAR
jgi:lysophospholipase L1-like esterase